MSRVFEESLFRLLSFRRTTKLRTSINLKKKHKERERWWRTKNLIFELSKKLGSKNQFVRSDIGERAQLFTFTLYLAGNKSCSNEYDKATLIVCARVVSSVW